ncbi:MAG TPA: hypothetical protein ENK23_07725, partial [Sorangium sp.]|nr:hypothetical protein [Sorangium sp.]
MASSTPAPAFRVSDRTLVGLCAVGTTNFVGCYAIAIALYPGGSWFDRHASGHSLARNFLCDLMQARALNGEPAVVGSLLARLGVVAMLLALAAFYSLVARLEGPPTHAGRITQGAGWLACVMGLAIPILTSDHHREAHIASVLGAFVPSLVATIFALIITLRVKGTSWWLRGAAVVTLVAGGIDGLL